MVLLSYSEISSCSRPVGSHDHHGRHIVLQRPVEEGEALDVEHVNLVKKENTGRYLGLALLPPLGHLCVNLIADLNRNTLLVLRLTGLTRTGK